MRVGASGVAWRGHSANELSLLAPRTFLQWDRASPRLTLAHTPTQERVPPSGTDASRRHHALFVVQGIQRVQQAEDRARRPKRWRSGSKPSVAGSRLLTIAADWLTRQDDGDEKDRVFLLLRCSCSIASRTQCALFISQGKTQHV